MKWQVQIMRGHKFIQFYESQEEFLLLCVHLVLNRKDYEWVLRINGFHYIVIIF